MQKTPTSLSHPSSFEDLLLDFATNNPHDLLVKITLSDLDVARHYFQTHLPKHIYNRLDWSQLKLVDVPIIDEKLTSLHSDLLFFVPFISDGLKNTTQKNPEKNQREWMCLYIVHEHQSTVDPQMPYRILQYMMGVWNDFRKQHGIQKSRHPLPHILPIVFYTGERKWTAPLKFQDMFPQTYGMKVFVPHFNLLLIDVQKTDLQKYRPIHKLFMMALMMKFIRRTQFLDVMLEHGLELSLIWKHDEVYYHQMMTYIVGVKGEEGMNDIKQMSDLDKLIEATKSPHLDPNSALAKILHQMIENRKEGMKQGQKEIITNMYNKGQSVEFIAEMVNLPIQSVMDVLKKETTQEENSTKNQT